MRSAPLEDVVVLDLTRVLAGPYLTMMLGEMGARIIKVENPDGGDDARGFGPFIDGESAYFASVNRGKESIALNLKDSGDLSIFKALLKKADVLVENYRTHVMDKLGLGWENLQKINPKLIYTAVSGFGHTGPYKNRPAYDMVVQGMGGIMSLTGNEKSGPVRVGTSVGDITAGLFGLSGVLGALYDREKTEKGVKVDVAMLDSQVAILENAISRYFADDVVPGLMGLTHPSITPFAGLRAMHGEHIIIAAGNNGLFYVLCEVINRQDLVEDPRFQSNSTRTANATELYGEIENALKAKSGSDWLSLLESAGVPCGPINNIEQVIKNPQVIFRNMIVTAEGKNSRSLQMSGNPIKNSAYQDSNKRPPAPKLDQHREDILNLIDEI